MAATHIEHRFIPTKMQTVEEPVARAKFPIIAAAHHQERFDEENDAAIKHRITNADQRSEISWSSPFEREIPHRKQRGAPKQKSADKARSVQSVIRFFLLHSIALERDSSRKFSTPDLSSMRRGRDVGYPTPPARIRTCSIPACGSYRRYLASKRISGYG